MVKKKEIKKDYLECFDFLKESRKYIYSIMIVFFVFALFGFFFPFPESVLEKLLEYFREIIQKTQGYNSLEMIGFIFSNNLKATLFSMLLGFFLGLFSIFNAIVNGVVLGIAAKISVNNVGILSLWRLLPHGIFELPAVFISLGLGVKFGSFFLKKEKGKYFRIYLLKSLKVYFYVVLPLLILAAIIEGFLITL
jgi:stage II sporulation protein M